jgi:hypothetical protein
MNAQLTQARHPLGRRPRPDHPNGGARRPRLLPWLAASFLGSAALGAWFLIGPALGPGWYYKPGFGRAAYGYVGQALALAIPYGLALWAWHRGARAPMWLVLGGSVVLHVLVLFAPLPQSQDFYQYLFYGRMQAVHGANPMVVHPSQFSDDPWYVWIRWYSQPSVYGPVWTWLSFGVVKMAGDSLAAAFVGLKLAILALDLGVMAMIAAAWRGRGDPEGATWGVLAYGWNPLILISVPLAGVPDVALAAAFLGALLVRRRGHEMLATVLLTMAMLVKIYAVFGLLLHLALIAKERRWEGVARHGGVALAVTAFIYAPYWEGLRTFSGLLSTVGLTNVSLAGMVQLLLSRGLDLIGVPAAAGIAEILVRVISGSLLVAAITWAIRRIRDDETLWRGLVVVMAAYLYLTPWSFYWYAVVPVTLVTALSMSRLTYPILAFSATQLIVIRFEPVIAAWSLQTGLRYGLPVIPSAIRGRDARVAQRGAGRVSIPVPGPQAIPTARQP